MHRDGTRNAHTCAADKGKPKEVQRDTLEREAITRRMSQVDFKILVLSGKGGVGKSTVAVNLAVSLARKGKSVGLLDIDIHGPSVPRLLGLENRPVEATKAGLLPVFYGENLKVMSIGFLLQSRQDAVIWRGPMKFAAIRQFLKDVEWGELDYLIIDSPPGTGDEPLSVAQLIPYADGAIVVTTPQEVAVADVRRCVTFCRQLNLRVLGVIENMSGLVCPRCGATIEVFQSGGGKRMAGEMGLPFLGSVPLDPQIAEVSDAGTPFAQAAADGLAARAFERAIAPILALGREHETPETKSQSEEQGEEEKEMGTVRIAVPLANGRLAMHFGHCEQFALIDADQERKTILDKQLVAAPNHQPGLLPRWLRERGVTVVIAGGMGGRALSLFGQHGIEVRVGAPSEEPERLVALYLEGSLPSGENICDH